ncbi:MAG: hypothetical protein NZ789_14075, partial [Pseudomonadales bacterium]|nr:hypothetical protein [Pseudomonadales bacterium]
MDAVVAATQEVTRWQIVETASSHSGAARANSIIEIVDDSWCQISGRGHSHTDVKFRLIVVTIIDDDRPEIDDVTNVYSIPSVTARIHEC